MATLSRSRRSEKRREYGAKRPPLRRRGKVVVVNGFGVSLRVERGRLVVVDGAGRERRERMFSRATHGISRLVLLGGSGSISIAALLYCDRCLTEQRTE
jgi:hypothetical protein